MKNKVNEWIKSIVGLIIIIGIFSFYFMEKLFNTSIKYMRNNIPLIMIVTTTIAIELLIIKIFSEEEENGKIGITPQALLPMGIILMISFIKIIIIWD